MDWGPVITAGITGIVGLAGIGGTLVSAKITRKSAAENLRTSIGAEDERARLAEKRRIYAQALASLTAVNVMGKEERLRLPRPVLLTRSFSLLRATYGNWP